MLPTDTHPQSMAFLPAGGGPTLTRIPGTLLAMALSWKEVRVPSRYSYFQHPMKSAWLCVLPMPPW